MQDRQLLERKLQRAEGLLRLYRWCLITSIFVIAMLTVLLFFARVPESARAILIEGQVMATVRNEGAARAVRDRLLARARSEFPGQATFREKWEDVTRPADGARVLTVAQAVKALQGKVTVVCEAYAIETEDVRLAVVPTKEAAQNALDGLKVRYASASDAVVRLTRLKPQPSIRPCLALPSEIISDQAQALAKLQAARTEPQTYSVQAGDYPARIAARAGMSLAELMRLNPDLKGTELRVGQQVKVLSKSAGLTVVTVKETVTSEQVPPTLKRVPSQSLPRGQKKVTKPGTPGRKRVRWEVVMHDDREISRRSLSEETVSEPQPGEVLIGTAGGS